jgi:nucleoside-diphosphate-sugar epimerase
MKVAITSSSSLIGRIMVEILLSQNVEIVSVGRKHDSRVSNRVNWSLDEAIDIPDDVDSIFYLTYDHHAIKNKAKYRLNNIVKLEELLKRPGISEKIVIPLSESGSATAKSRYGQVKYNQQLLAEKYGCRTLRIGWMMDSNNGGNEIQKTIHLLRMLRINVLPNVDNRDIGITRYEDLVRAVLEVLHENRDSIAIAPKKTNLHQLIYDETTLRRMNVGSVTKLFLYAIPNAYPILPKKWVRAFDSARSVTF